MKEGKGNRLTGVARPIMHTEEGENSRAWQEEDHSKVKEYWCDDTPVGKGGKKCW